MNKIFISIASYRDSELPKTVKNLISNAEHPELLRIVVYEQNGPEDPSILGVYPKDQVLVLQDHFSFAKGPNWARAKIQKEYQNEEYYLQIDSHTTFVKDWDQTLINMINQIKSNPEESSKPVLSTYPPTKEQMDLNGFPEMDNGRLNANNIPSFLCGWSEESYSPKRSNKPWAAAGFMFLESDFLYEVPFDPNLSHLFQGEETLFSARLWTNGWDFYTPNKKVAYHHYNRTKAPLYHQDLKNSGDCRTKAEKRVLFLLGLVPKQSVAEGFLRQINYYSLGKFRSVIDFWKVSGIDFSSKTVERWNDNNPPSDKFKGYNFRRDGYKNIKKWK